jgi:hypothetical protein
MSSVEDMNCPICYKKYPVTEIESHANKCIFLNSGENYGASTKRKEDHKEANQTEKKQKRDGCTEQDHALQSQNVRNEQPVTSTMTSKK